MINHRLMLSHGTVSHIAMASVTVH